MAGLLDGLKKTLTGNTVLNAGTSLVGGALGLIGAKQQRDFESSEAAKQRQWSEAQVANQNAWNYRMWQETNEYNSPAAQKQRLQEAGLNPLFYGLDGSSAGGLTSAEPLGYDRASASAFQNPLQAGFEGAVAGANLQKDIELKNAQIDKLKEDTAGVSLDNDFKDKTLAARVEGERLANQLTREQISKVQNERQAIVVNIKKTIAETDSEVAKAALYGAQKAVEDAKAKEIVQLLPYRENLLKAQTDAQKAAASASFYSAMMNKGLIEAGYIDELVDKASEEARKAGFDADDAQTRAAIDAFKLAVKTGNVFDLPEPGAWSFRGTKMFFNGLFNAAGIVGEAITGPIANIFK